MAFALLSAALAVNMLVLQDARHVRSPGTATSAVESAAAERARRLALPVEGNGASVIPSAAVLHVAPDKPIFAGPAGDPHGVDTVKAVQRELLLKGYHPGTADGVPGLLTRAAIMAFEHDQELPLTGEASDGLLRAILLGETGAGATGRGGARRMTAAGAAEIIRTVQKGLTELGYAPGRADGQMSAETSRAIRSFEAAHGLSSTGRVSGRLLGKLMTATERPAKR